ncbi:hypothetical protein jhhlp_000537 [Lomentospora prolificans]|uniref:Glycosyl transferase n=1 Tax=Lomentospora prolificans TaxID=41688 RepID=A0A2N3NLE0_9PEZI|nr:hypothetical protein jhhlp_000537 [Lomentospora prolificans]
MGPRYLIRYGKLVLASAVVVFFILFFKFANLEAYGLGTPARAEELVLHPGSPPTPNVWETVDDTHGPRLNKTYDTDIPNIVHYVYLFQEGMHDFGFQFKEALSLYSAWAFTDPDVIYLHTNADVGAIERARSGKVGKWNSIILNVPQLVIRHVEAPEVTDQGIEIVLPQHKSDFVRVAAVEEIGGVYLDLDAIPLRDLRPLLEMGYNTVVGNQADGVVMSGNFIGKAHCKFLTQWREQMHQAYNGEWVRHSNDLMTMLAKPLSKLDHELIILDSRAMGPNHWNFYGTQPLYRAHNDVPSNLEGLEDGAPLREFHDNLGAIRDGLPSWQRDYSHTYILHSWREKRGLFRPHGFDHATPRYVLERRSDFSRAVYHIAKQMYDRGFISFDDPWRYAVAGN